MCVKRSVENTAAASVDETTAPSRIGLEPREVEQRVRRDACDERADDHADRAEERRRHGDLAQPPPRGLEPALVEDQRRGRRSRPRARASRRRTRSRPARPSRAASRARGTRRGRAGRCVRRRARRRCSRRGSRRRAEAARPSSTRLLSCYAVELVGWIIVAAVVVATAVLVLGLFIWGAVKDGQEDEATQRRLGIRRRTRLGR